MKIKVSEASGPVLDWMVAFSNKLRVYKAYPDRILVIHEEGGWYEYNPSTDWQQGGPIIEREEICTRRQSPCSAGYEWNAWIWTKHVAKGGSSAGGSGPTPLIAAMRCYVVSKLGDEVEVPTELLKENENCQIR